MSFLTKMGSKFGTYLHDHLFGHSGKTEQQVIEQILKEGKALLAGFEGAAKDAPALVAAGERLAVDAAKLAGDVATKTPPTETELVNAFEDLMIAASVARKTLADFEAARSAAQPT